MIKNLLRNRYDAPTFSLPQPFSWSAQISQEKASHVAVVVRRPARGQIPSAR